MNSTRQLFLQHQAQTSPFPLLLEIARAEGMYLYDTTGKKYLDFISGISVSSLGHGNVAVKNAIKEQVDKYMHLMVYGEFVQEPQALLAQKLTSLLPLDINSVYFVNSGAEAVDGAMKLAKRFTGRAKVLACKNAYHGSTHAALSLNSHEEYKQNFRPLLPAVDFIEFNNEESLSLINEEVACIFAEPIQGEAGYIPATQSFLEALRNRCNQTGALLIFDEIQSGMGRSGKLFAFEHYGINPDILLLGKALGAGMPIGAFLSSNEIMKCLTDNPVLGHITTFGGHPVVCAAALAGLNELLEKKFVDGVQRKEFLIRNALQAHPAIRQISGKGLMLSLEMESFEKCLNVVQRCIGDGLIVDWFLFAQNRLRLAPPLIAEDNEIKAACEIVLKNCS